MDPTTPSRRRRRPYNRADHVDEVALVTSLQLEASTTGDSGPAWQAIKHHVYLYAQRTLTKQITNGQVWTNYHRLGGRPALDLRTPAHGVDHDTAHDLAADTLLGALPVLHDQLLTGRWDPTRGASLRTWTVNLAILRLPTAWRAWRRDTHQRLPDHVAERHPAPDQPEAVIYSIEIDRFIDILDDDTLATIVRLDAAGLTDDEIAAHVGRTRKSVEYQLAKARDQLRHRRALEAERDQRTGAA